jgi:hypothetical protein
MDFKVDFNFQTMARGRMFKLALNCNFYITFRLGGGGESKEIPIFLEEYNKMYEKFKFLPIIIEGPEPDQDFSYFMVSKCDDLKDLEKGLNLKTYSKEVLERDAGMEFRILARISCHKIHYRSIFKSQNIDFKNKNRYQEVLPFEHSMVKLKDMEDKTDRYWFYVNANYINVRFF